MKDYNEYSKIAYNNKADNYDDTPEGKFTKKFKDLLCEIMILEKGINILDVACGNGTLLKMLTAKNEIHGYGIDISDKMVSNAKKNCRDMVFKVAGCEEIPFESDFFESMTVCAAYHHFPDTDSFAREAARVLKKNGYLYIAEIYLPAIIRVLCNPFVKLSKEGDVKFYSPKEIVSNFEMHGFQCSRVVRRENVQIVCMQKKHRS